MLKAAGRCVESARRTKASDTCFVVLLLLLLLLQTVRTKKTTSLRIFWTVVVHGRHLLLVDLFLFGNLSISFKW